jgi:hypothetical protein
MARLRLEVGAPPHQLVDCDDGAVARGPVKGCEADLRRYGTCLAGVAVASVYDARVCRAATGSNVTRLIKVVDARLSSVEH